MLSTYTPYVGVALTSSGSKVILSRFLPPLTPHVNKVWLDRSPRRLNGFQIKLYQFEAYMSLIFVLKYRPIAMTNAACYLEGKVLTHMWHIGHRDSFHRGKPAASLTLRGPYSNHKLLGMWALNWYSQIGNPPSGHGARSRQNLSTCDFST